MCSCSSLPVLSPGVSSPSVLLTALTCSNTAVMSGEPVMRSARTNARRRIAASRHARSGCSQAPRPGRFLAWSTVTACSPFPSTATTRSSSTASSRFRQPTHVRTGPSGRRCAEAEVSRWITAESTVPVLANRNGSTWGSRALPVADRPVCRIGVRLRRGVASDIDPPAGEPGGQPGVLPLLADR